MAIHMGAQVSVHESLHELMMLQWWYDATQVIGPAAVRGWLQESAPHMGLRYRFASCAAFCYGKGQPSADVMSLLAAIGMHCMQQWHVLCRGQLRLTIARLSAVFAMHIVVA